MPQLTLAGLMVTPYASADFIHDLDVLDGPSSMRVDRSGSGYFVWSVGAGAQLLRHVSGFLDYRRSANVDDAAWEAWSWGLRFEAPL